MRWPRYKCVGLFLLLAAVAPADEVVSLPDTGPLTSKDDLADKMMDGLHAFIERKIAGSVEQRGRHWQRDTSSAAAYEKSIEANRRRFQKIIGAVDPRVPVSIEYFGDEGRPSLVAETSRYQVYQVRWPVLEGVWGEGLRLTPKGESAGYIVALPDADQTPEQLAGLAPGVENNSQFARRLAEAGFMVLIPTLLDRSDRFSGIPGIAWTNQPHREWIYRQAYHMGRHPIGYEVQKVLAAVDWFKQHAGGKRIGVAGYGEGGLLAFYAAAADPRIDACLVSGYFEPHARPWEEPIYRNLWGLLREFGDAEIATLIAPRGLVVEYSDVPAVNGPPPVEKGRKGGAAAGKLTTPSFAAVQAEFQRIDKLLPPGFQERHLIAGSGERTTPFGSQGALESFARFLGSTPPGLLPREAVTDRRKKLDPAGRQERQVKQVEAHVQRLVRTSEKTRTQFFPLRGTTKPLSLEQLVKEAPGRRQYLWEEVLGKFGDPLLPPNPRSRKIYDTPKWVGYDVVLDVLPDVFAWGVLLLPKDMKPGERRPVVVCQHGRNGVPKDVIEGDHRAYHDFAAKLAERGFITFAPHNPYRGEDRYRFLSRKGNSVKASLFSFILAQHEQILNWLEKLPQVDPKRIAFYGLSYGGETAVRVPPLLERYCLSICSADFNDWARKVASTETSYTFMYTIEWEMPYFDMGSTFNYAEMAALMLPRPFMVERGHDDPVAPDEMVAHEYAKVRRLYDQLDLGERTAIEFFNGGHTINGQGTFAFLHRHLKWPQ